LSSPPETNVRTHHGWRETFVSLRNRNFRLFLTGLFITGTGGWVQRIAQDWLVLSITGSATAVGITAACQFVPTLLLGLLGGIVADRYPKRLVLLVTQASMSVLAATLAALTLAHQVQVWQVYLLALGLGVATAVDNPTRQSFVTELVEAAQLRNAVSLVSSTFQLGAMIGPGISGLLIATVGSGFAFSLNAISYLGAIAALVLIRDQAAPLARPEAEHNTRIRTGLAYAAEHPTVLWPIVLVGICGLFTISLPVTLSAFAKVAFHSGAAGYGLLSSTVALGSITGALASARRTHDTRLRNLIGIAGTLSAAEIVAGLAPTQAAFLPLLFALGGCTLYFITTAQSMVQLGTQRALRGRVLGIYMLVFIGGGALGGPLVGFVDESLGPRAGLLVAGATSAAATALIGLNLARIGRLRIEIRYRRGLAVIVPR
jgi:MFS family permease